MNDRFGNISISNKETKEPPQKAPAPVKERPPKRKKRKSRSGKPLSRTTKLILWLLVLPAALVGLYCLAGFVLVPGYVKEKMPVVLQEKLGINSSVGKVAFNPFTFKLTVTDFSLEDRSQKSSSSPLVHINSLTGTISPFELIRNNVAVKQLFIDTPEISIIRFGENEYNFSQYISTDQLNSEEAFLNFATLPFLYSINNISVSNGEVQFIDRPSGKNHQIKKLEVSIPTLANFDYQTDIVLQSNFSAELNGSPLVINSDESQDGNGLSIDLNQIALSDYIQYLPFDLPIKIDSGTANGKLQLAFDQEKKLAIKYQLDIEKISGNTTDEMLHIAIPSSRIIGSYQPIDGSLFLENVYLKAPLIRANEAIRPITINSLLPRQLNNKPPENSAPVPAVAVHRLLINEGTFEGTFHKERLAIENLEFTLKDLNTRIKNSDQLNPGTFSLKGKDKDQGVLSWQGNFTDKHSMTGKYQLLHFSGNDLCRILWQDSLKCIAADTEMKGVITVSQQQETDKTTNLYVSLTDSSINLESPDITSDSTKFKASKLLAAGISYEASKKKIDKLTIKDIDIAVADNDVASLVAPVMADNTVQILSLDVSGKASITNQQKQQPLVLDRLFLQAQIDPKDASSHAIDFKAYNGLDGIIRANGNASLFPLAFTVSVSFDSIDIRDIFPLLSSNPVSFQSEAVISGKGQYTYPQSGFFGSIESGPAKIISGGKQIGQWQKASFSSVIYKSAPYSFRIKESTLINPAFYYSGKKSSKITPDRIADFVTILLPVKNLPQNPAKYKYPFYHFETIDVKNGMLISQAGNGDQSTEYTNISGTISNVQFPTNGTESSFSFQAKQKKLPLKIAGSGVFLQSPSNGTYTYNFTQPELAPIIPEAQAAGIDIRQAELKGQVKSEWFNGKALYKFDLTTGKILPFDNDSSAALTLALLYKDSPRFNILFEYNQAGQADTTPFHQMVLDYFKRNQLKTQISPFLLTPEFTDLVDLTHIGFRDGSSELTADAIEWLTRVGLFLQNYPLVKLQLVPGVTENDKAELQRQNEEIESQRVAKENEKRYQEWQEENLKISRQREEREAQNSNDPFMEEDLSTPEIEPFTPIRPKPVTVTPTELNELASKRQEAVAVFLERSLHVSEAQLEKIERVSRNQKGENGIKLQFSTRFRNPDA